VNRPGFPWKLLKRVSRSFYLSLRLLPGDVRESIALAYLVARLSDTEADGARGAAEEELLDRKPEVLDLLRVSPDRELIDDVWSTIREGQAFDSMRFVEPRPLSADELARYTYLVAGCVGEFWTRICEKKLPGFAMEPLDEMLRMGREFGEGLQLVNILRDRQVDAKAGRVYVPEERFAETLALTRRKVAGGISYARANRFRRLRAACLLPALLAEGTLNGIEENPRHPRVKVSRMRTMGFLIRALLAGGRARTS
jgi:farnesyl-diphosphate farnesyltransferase